MVNFNDFNDAGFDPVAWVNAAANAKPGEEALERYLAELEMKLQLHAEELEAGLAEASTQAMRRIPFAVQEIVRLQVKHHLCRTSAASQLLCSLHMRRRL